MAKLRFVIYRASSPRAARGLLLKAAALIFLAFGLQPANAKGALKPEPVPSEVVDWQTVHRECGRGKQYVNKEGEDCIRRVVGRMPAFDPAKRELFGAQYDPAKYLECRLREKSWGSACGMFFTLQRLPAPEYWPRPGTPRPHVPPPDLDKLYRTGISQKEYFAALCRAYAGEFIQRTVENIESIYQIRPRALASDYEIEDPYVIEDPYGYFVSESFDFLVLYAGGARHPRGPRYSFVEGPNVLAHTQFGKNSDYIRIDIPDPKERARGTAIDSIRSKYGFTWRDITGVRERELGIAGGDLIVVDLETGEVLGHRRGFARSPLTKRTIGGVSWRNSENCPSVKTVAGEPYRGFGLDGYFLRKVLKPVSIEGR
jgi:hypothetical protein